MTQMWTLFAPAGLTLGVVVGVWVWDAMRGF